MAEHVRHDPHPAEGQDLLGSGARHALQAPPHVLESGDSGMPESAVFHALPNRAG